MESNYKTDHVEETIQQTGEPCDDGDIKYDDSFLDDEDKKKLIDVIMNETKNSPNNRWMDEIMLRCLAMYKYKKIINKMDVEEYKREKEEIKKNPLKMLVNF